MSLDINDIVSKWEKDEPNYKALGERVVKMLKELIYELELHPDVTHRVKDLLSIIRKIKKKNLSKEYAYEDLHDRLGIRVVCSFTDEMEVIDKLIQANFNVVEVDKKKEVLDHNRLDYISNHYDLSIDPQKDHSKDLAKYKDLVFEVQVKTLNQHTWSNTSHALSYKQEANLSDAFKRKVFRLLSLYEIADDEFALVNTALKNAADNWVYSVLRKTEGKIYKYAKVDFDRDYSLYVLNALLNYFDQEQKGEILKQIDSFISVNEQKIRRIFSENSHRLFKLSFLTQPEVFVIWYALEKFPFSITDNWENDFDQDELEQIQDLWGKDI